MEKLPGSKPFTIHKLWILDPDLASGHKPLHLCKWIYIEEWIRRIESTTSLCRGEYRSVKEPDVYCVLGHAFEVHNEQQTYSLWRLVSVRDSLGKPRSYWSYNRNPFTEEDWYGLGRCRVLYEYSHEDPSRRSVELIKMVEFLYRLNDKYLLGPKQIADTLKASLHPARSDSVVTESRGLEIMLELKRSASASS